MIMGQQHDHDFIRKNHTGCSFICEPGVVDKPDGRIKFHGSFQVHYRKIDKNYWFHNDGDLVRNHIFNWLIQIYRFLILYEIVNPTKLRVNCDRGMGEVPDLDKPFWQNPDARDKL